MGRQHVVKTLNEAEFDFVINAMIAGKTNREISLAFQEAFDKKLAKSSLNRWRNNAGDELAERYQLARYQARQLLSDLKEEDQDKYQVVIRNIEDRLLTATREVIAKDPVKLLRIRQEEEKRRLKERELGLKERQLELEREKFRGAEIDRGALGIEFITDLLEYLGQDAEGLQFFKRHAKPFNDFLKTKYGTAQQ